MIFILSLLFYYHYQNVHFCVNNVQLVTISVNVLTSMDILSFSREQCICDRRLTKNQRCKKPLEWIISILTTMGLVYNTAHMRYSLAYITFERILCQKRIQQNWYITTKKNVASEMEIFRHPSTIKSCCCWCWCCCFHNRHRFQIN